MTGYIYSDILSAGARHRSGRAIMFLIYFLIAPCLFIFLTSATAQGNNQYAQATTAVENLASEIRMNEGAVGQVLMEAMQSKHGDLRKWQALDEKMKALGESVDKNLPEIGSNIAIIRAVNPDYTPPSVALGRTFEGNLNMAKNKKKELLDLAQVQHDKLNKINQLIAKVDKNLGNAAKGLAGATMEGFLPDEKSLAAEATVIVLGAYFGPVGIVVAGTAWAATATFNAMVNLYYNTKAAADQAKVLGQMKQGLQARKAELEKNFSTLKEGASSMEQIERILEKHEKSMTEYKSRINAAVGGWNDQQKSAFEERKKKIEEKIKETMSRPASTSKWTLCNGSVVSLAPGDYTGEVSSMVSELESYTRAVEDGGDPDTYYAMVVDWHNKINDQYKQKSEDYKRKSEAARSAFSACWNSYVACTRSARNSESYSACYRSYCGCIMPTSAALANSQRELSRIYRIHDSVRNVYYYFQERVSNAIKAHTRDFWNEYRLWETKFGEANAKVQEAVDPVPWWTDQWKTRANKLDEEIEHSLYWGGNIADIRTGLFDTARQLKELDKTVKEAAKKYAEANSERMRVANLAQAELTSILNQYGRLINYYWGSNFSLSWLGSPMEFTPHAPEQERNIERLAAMIERTFTIYEPENLKNAQKLDILGIAAIYENKANELTFYTDWVDTYRYRAAKAAGALNRISIEKTGQGFYADRGGSAQEVLSKEFSKPPWSAIASDAEKYVSREDFATLPWGRYQSWDGLGIWQKLYAGQTILLNKLNKDGRSYVQAKLNGSFIRLPARTIDPLVENWKKLREVCERYDAVAKPEHDKIGDGQEQVEKEAQLVFETWGKLPAHSRTLVRDEHGRFSSAYDWLRSYLRSKFDATKTTLQPPTNSVAMQLDDLILGYAPAYEKWKKQQEEAERRMEEQRRQWEAAEKARIEQEKKKAEEALRKAEEEKRQAEAKMTLVKDFYARFKEAYEGRNDSQIMSMISDEWEAGDGSTLSDLQETLSRSFQTFDEIRYNIQNLSITSGQEGRYSVSYDLTITSRIYKRNLKHEEKSSVNEEVTIDSSGKVKISKTLGGRFWYSQ